MNDDTSASTATTAASGAASAAAAEAAAPPAPASTAAAATLAGAGGGGGGSGAAIAPGASASAQGNPPGAQTAQVAQAAGVSGGNPAWTQGPGWQPHLWASPAPPGAGGGRGFGPPGSGLGPSGVQRTPVGRGGGFAQPVFPGAQPGFGRGGGFGPQQPWQPQQQAQQWHAQQQQFAWQQQQLQQRQSAEQWERQQRAFAEERERDRVAQRASIEAERARWESQRLADEQRRIADDARRDAEWTARLDAAVADAKKAHDSKEATRVLPEYPPHYPDRNPHKSRPAHQTLEPAFYDARGDRTFDSLEKVKSAAYYEFKTLLAASSYLADGQLHYNDWQEDIEKALHDGGRADLVEHVRAVANNARDVYKLLINPRLQHHQFKQLLQVNGKLPPEKAGLLQAFEHKMYGVIGEPLPANIDDFYREALSEWEKEYKKSAVKSSAVKSAAAGAQRSQAAARGGGGRAPYSGAAASAATPAAKGARGGAVPKRQ